MTKFDYLKASPFMAIRFLRLASLLDRFRFRFLLMAAFGFFMINCFCRILRMPLFFPSYHQTPPSLPPHSATRRTCG